MLQQLFSPTSLKILFKCLLWLLGEHYVNSVWEPRNTFYRKCLMIPLSKHNFLGETLRNWKKTRSVIRRQLQIHTSNFKTAQKDKAKGLLIFKQPFIYQGCLLHFFYYFFYFPNWKRFQALSPLNLYDIHVLFNTAMRSSRGELHVVQHLSSSQPSQGHADTRGQADLTSSPARCSAPPRYDIMAVLRVYLRHKLPQEAFCQNFNIKVVTASIVNSFVYLGDKGSWARS